MTQSTPVAVKKFPAHLRFTGKIKKEKKAKKRKTNKNEYPACEFARPAFDGRLDGLDSASKLAYNRNMTVLSENLDHLTVPGELLETLEGGALRCYACAHRCLIKPGRRGICQVRFNQDGELRVPWGYVAALQVDPIEKKPFSHFLPGSDALTFGMLGCDFHCSYCFPGDTVVITDRGPVSLETAFHTSSKVSSTHDAEIAYPEGLQALTSEGSFRPVRAVFKHHYQGEMVIIQPYYFPKIRCTPDHRIYATLDPSEEPKAIPARELTRQHYLVIPRYQSSATPAQTIDLVSLLENHQITFKVRWKLTDYERQYVQTATEQGMTSRDIGAVLGKSGSYIRHVRGRLARNTVLTEKTSGPLVEDGNLRFPNEHHPGLPVQVPVDESLARLLGYYCAEGSVVQSLDRPNSLVLNFSFSPKEQHLAEEVNTLVQTCFGVKGRLSFKKTTTTMYFSKASLAHLFTTLCGKGAAGKRIPQVMFDAPVPVAQAFVDAYVEGDGHKYQNGKIIVTTVSSDLAYGIAMLALKLGYFPSVYEKFFQSGKGMVEGRIVSRAPSQYTIVWYESSTIQRKIVETKNAYLIPLRSLSRDHFDGCVYNMEVEEIHNYLAGFLLVSNCQNWVTSQVGRDEQADIALSSVTKTSPEQLVKLALQNGAGVVVSSYNEPLITSEWAVAVFRQAKAAGLRCAFVSNGNATPEALAYLRPYLSGYKVDLKTMQDRQYRKLGGVLNHVLDTIRMARELGLWVEVVTLVIPGFNDSPSELWDAARYLASVSPDIPWHVTAFHPDYKMDADYTPPETLRTAAEIGQEAGLRYVYAGNLPGRVGTYEDTFCPSCGERLIQRKGYILQDYRITAQGTCPKCHSAVPGIWTDRPETVRLGGPGYPRRVR